VSEALQASETLAEDLTEREREILALLVRNGGHLRQREVAESLEISKGPASEYISSLTDGGHLEKVELGLENVLYLPGCEPDIVQSSLRGSNR